MITCWAAFRMICWKAVRAPTATGGGEGTDVFIFRGSHGPDVVGDFTLDDLLVLGPEYWAGHLTAGELLEDHATQMMNGVMLQTGTNSIFILGWEDIDTLGGRLRSVDQLL